MLISVNSLASTASFFRVSDGEFSHDQITRELSNHNFNGREYWKTIKPTVRKFENDEAIMILDGFLNQKPHSEESQLVTYHWDNLNKKISLGIKIVNLFYYTEEASFFLDFEPIIKSEVGFNFETSDWKTYSPQDEHQSARLLLRNAKANEVKYKTIVFDAQFASSETLTFIHKKLEKLFVCPIATNRNVKLVSAPESKYQQVSKMDLQEGVVYEVFIKGVKFPVRLVKAVFINKDDSHGTLFLISNMQDVTSKTIISTYKLRFKIEDGHRAVKAAQARQVPLLRQDTGSRDW
jgi:hypothetical protein